MELNEKITQIVSEVIQIPQEELSPGASFFDDYGMDSLRALEILAEVENEYDIMIDPEKLPQMTCIDEIVRITEECLDSK